MSMRERIETAYWLAVPVELQEIVHGLRVLAVLCWRAVRGGE